MVFSDVPSGIILYIKSWWMAEVVCELLTKNSQRLKSLHHRCKNYPKDKHAKSCKVANTDKPSVINSSCTSPVFPMLMNAQCILRKRYMNSYIAKLVEGSSNNVLETFLVVTFEICTTMSGNLNHSPYQTVFVSLALACYFFSLFSGLGILQLLWLFVVSN